MPNLSRIARLTDAECRNDRHAIAAIRCETPAGERVYRDGMARLARAQVRMAVSAARSWQRAPFPGFDAAAIAVEQAEAKRCVAVYWRAYRHDMALLARCAVRRRPAFAIAAE